MQEQDVMIKIIRPSEGDLYFGSHSLLQTRQPKAATVTQTPYRQVTELGPNTTAANAGTAYRTVSRPPCSPDPKSQTPDSCKLEALTSALPQAPNRATRNTEPDTPKPNWRQNPEPKTQDASPSVDGGVSRAIQRGSAKGSSEAVQLRSLGILSGYYEASIRLPSTTYGTTWDSEGFYWVFGLIGLGFAVEFRAVDL